MKKKLTVNGSAVTVNCNITHKALGEDKKCFWGKLLIEINGVVYDNLVTFKTSYGMTATTSHTVIETGRKFDGAWKKIIEHLIENGKIAV